MQEGARIYNGLKELTNQIRDVKAAVQRDKMFEAWIDEDTAAASLGYRPRSFRRKVVAGQISVNFRSTNGRKYQYSRKDIIKFQTQTSTQL